MKWTTSLVWLMAAVLGAVSARLPAGSAFGEEVASAIGEAVYVVSGALTSKATPALVRSVATGSAETALAATLASDAERAAQAMRPHLGAAERLAARDGEAALLFATWWTDIHETARKATPDRAEIYTGLAEAWLFRARVGKAFKEKTNARAWIEAADARMAHAERTNDPDAKRVDALAAIAWLHEGVQEKRPAQRLLDHASAICAATLKQFPDSDPIRRAVAKSYRTKAILLVKNKRVAQRALEGYFEAMSPIVAAERAVIEDVLTFNEMVTFARTKDIGVKVDYIVELGSGCEAQLLFSLPRTGRWRDVSGEIIEGKPKDTLYRRRVVEFGVYRWDSIYSLKGDVRTTGGDNVKGVAAIHFREMEATFSKRKRKTSKPSRKRLNKTLPSCIAYTLEGRRRTGNFKRDMKAGRIRMTSFFVKSVKAELTLRITITEQAKPTVDDPEWEAILDSFELTKTSR